MFRGKRSGGDIKLVVGLGNPGRRYEKTRHNLGFMSVSHFGKANGIRFDKKQADARVGAGQVQGLDLLLARPQTFMNNSGRSVSRLVKNLKIKPEDVVVIYDEMDLPLGKIRLRGGGGSGGHNGIKSIIAELGSPDFNRIRVGIGRPPYGGRSEEDNGVIDYLLSDFTPQEMKAIQDTLPQVDEALLCLLTEGLTEAMNRYN